MITNNGNRGRLSGFSLLGGHHHKVDLSHFGIGEKAVTELMAFKASERKDDPARIQGIHGPYEEGLLRKTGRLHESYYEAGDPEPWGLRRKESESNILYQILYWPTHPQYKSIGADYFGLVKAQSTLGDAEYAKEARKINKDWGDYLEQAGLHANHVHRVIGDEYNRIACTACSMLTAFACRDTGMLAIFEDFLSCGAQERMARLNEMGLSLLLRTTIPDIQPKLIMKG